MRRKEQNRAAQRAFRERKEKHVQDLEGRVAELEAAQRAKDTENDNLRDLLTRLQEENRVLKESAFSFSMPPPTTARTQSQQQQQQQQPPPPPPLIHHSSSSSSSASQFSMPEPSVTPQLAPNSPLAGDIDWASLTTFDPAALNMLDADINMMDFSADGSFPDLGGAPYRTLASNPMFMSFAEPFSAPPSRQGSGGWDPLSFASFGSWAGAPVQSPPQQQQQQHVGWPPSRQSSHSQSEFDALLGLAGPGPMMDIATPNSISPILHASGQPGPRPAQRTSSGSSTLPDLSGVTHPFQYAPGALGGASPGSASSLFSPEPAPSAEEHNPARCPRTKADFAARIANGLKSPFAPAGTPGSVSASPSLGLAPGGAGVSCEGSAFPKTERSEHNIEVLQAWRQITSDPAFKVSLPWLHRMAGTDSRIRRTLTSMSCAPSSRTRPSATARASYSTPRA
jgi:AP-1-like factor